MRNTYLQMCDYGSRFRILKGGKISLVVSAFFAGVTLLHAAPSGGVVTSGTANIAQNGAVTTINQSSQKASINWTNFSIGASETVNFNQPNVSAIALNRVVGNEKSIIDGALNANGQVWILNSNGVLFNSTAKINTSGLLATTKSLSDEDFQTGNYIFKGESSASVINLGEVTINNGGYASFLANTAQNEGVIKAIRGVVTLTGANEAVINLNGNSLVSLKVNKGVLDALVENKGAILAEGGKVYLTTNAVDELLKGVVNNTGIIEAKSIDDISSEVVLYAHGGTTNVSGTIDASGGFVETSGKNLSVMDNTIIKAKTWLLDPTNVVIDASSDALGGETVGASVIASTLTNGTSVVVEADQDININESIVTGNMANDATLTFKAGEDIVVNNGVTIDATQNSNTKKLNVYISVSNLVNGGGFVMNGDNSSIKTNGGNVIIGGVLESGIPQISGTFTNNNYIALNPNSLIDVGTGDIIMAAGGTNNSLVLIRSILKAKNITLEAFENNELRLEGSTLEALNGNVLLSGNPVNTDSSYDGDTGEEIETIIKADQLTVNASQQIEMKNTMMNLKNRATFNAGDSVDLSNSMINFTNSGTLEINSFQSSSRSDYIATLLSDWGAANEIELLASLNDDEGTNYTSIDQFVANVNNQTPTFVNLKGGSYITKAFSDGSANTINASTLQLLNNGLLAFGNGLEGSVNEFGMLKQPFYYDQVAGRWYKLTYSNYPLAAIIGIGGDGANEWNLNGTIVSTIEDGSSAFSNAVLNTSGLANGYGTIIATNTVTIDGQTLEMTNTYTLSNNQALIAMDTKLKNTSSTNVENIRVWVGAQDDWIALSDETTKERGNLSNGSFVAISDSTERAKALMITGTTSGVLFRTTSEKSNVFSKENYGSDFYTQDPATSPVLITESDGAYGVFTRFSNLTATQSDSIRWYYGAGSIADLANLAESVSQQPSTPNITPPPPTPSTPIVETPKIIDAIASGIAVQPPVVPNFTPPPLPSIPQQFSFGGQAVQLMSTPLGESPTQIISLGEIRQMQQENTSGAEGVKSPDIRIPLGQNSLIQLVNGGLRLPEGIEQEFFMAQR